MFGNLSLPERDAWSGFLAWSAKRNLASISRQVVVLL
jgi:hypothetical protein